MFISCIIVGIGGFAGAVSRFFISTKVQEKTGSFFPYGTLTVNMLGCFIIGVIFSILEYSQIMGPGFKHLIVTGFLGALTTFSTFSYETFELIREKNILQALANIFIQIIAGVILVFLGFKLTSLFI